MSRTPAKFTQADIARSIRAAKQAGAAAVELRRDGAIRIFSMASGKALKTLTATWGLDNADPSTHYLDIDEFNVHALIPAGKSNVALFKPTQPGTYTFYCHPHADKAARAGMVGTLVVEP